MHPFHQLIGLLGLGGSGTLIARGSSEFMIINTILAAESLILLIMSVFLLIGTWKVHLSLFAISGRCMELSVTQASARKLEVCILQNDEIFYILCV